MLVIWTNNSDEDNNFLCIYGEHSEACFSYPQQVSEWEEGCEEDVYQHDLSGITMNCFPGFLCLDSYILIDMHLVG